LLLFLIPTFKPKTDVISDNLASREEGSEDTFVFEDTPTMKTLEEIYGGREKHNLSKVEPDKELMEYLKQQRDKVRREREQKKDQQRKRKAQMEMRMTNLRNLSTGI
jgi:hypothetical protein